MKEPHLNFYAKIVAAATFVLIIAGGLVTSTNSGLSVPDWPLSYGQFFPPMVGGIRFEHSHRVIAGIVGILTLVLAGLFIKFEKRNWVRILSGTAFLAVVLQAVLGGLTVLYLLPDALSVFHACLGQTFFCLVVSLVFFTSREWRESKAIFSEEAASIHRLLIITASFVYLQLITGAVVRHTEGGGINYHFILAFLIALHSLLIILKISRTPEIREKLFKNAAALGLLVIVQIFLGFGAFITTLMLPKSDAAPLAEVFFASMHQANGALVLATSLLLALRAVRFVKILPAQNTVSAKAARAHAPFLNYLELTKPRLTFTVLFMVLLGFFIGSKNPLDYALLFHVLLGSALVGGGANALNEYLEKDVDARMKRTEDRPLPSGRIGEKNALFFGIALSAFGTAYLFFFTNLLTGLLGLTTLLGYVLVYTPLKRKTWLNTFVGAVPGALPILMGWTASGAPLGLKAGVLFLILFLWQLPHFFAIAWLYREDYRRGGLKMMTTFDEGGEATAWQIAIYSLALFFATLVPAIIGIAGFVYLSIAALAGLFFTGFAVFMCVTKLHRARRFVILSILHLLIIATFMMADKL